MNYGQRWAGNSDPEEGEHTSHRTEQTWIVYEQVYLGQSSPEYTIFVVPSDERL